MKRRPRKERPRVTQIGPALFLCIVPDCVPLAYDQRRNASRIATNDELLLEGVLAWYERQRSSVARLWGEDCALQLGTTTAGAWYVIARRTNGEARVLASRSMIACAELQGSTFHLSSAERLPW